MTDHITKYFNSTEALDELSVTEIEHMITQTPSSSVYKLLLAKKMSTIDGHQILLGNTDRVMMHYLIDNQTNIPSVNDSQVSDLSVDTSVTQNDNNTHDIHNTESMTSDEPILDISISHEEVSGQTNQVVDKSDDIIISQTVEVKGIENVDVVAKKGKIRKKKKKNKFKLKEYSGISDFSKWLLSFKQDDVEKQIRKEEKAAKKRALEQNAKKSVTKSPSIISEPLADLLASQGHLDDAKKMFEQLMQKYPEKSSYFAAKINLLIKS